MKKGEIWFTKTPGGDRPVLVLTRDPVADRIGSVVVAALTRTRRGLASELELTPDLDGVPTHCVVNFDNLHTLPREVFRRPVTQLSPERIAHRAGYSATRWDAEIRFDRVRKLDVFDSPNHLFVEAGWVGWANHPCDASPAWLASGAVWKRLLRDSVSWSLSWDALPRLAPRCGPCRRPDSGHWGT